MNVPLFSRTCVPCGSQKSWLPRSWKRKYYSVVHNSIHPPDFSGNQYNHKIFVPQIVTDLNRDEAKKNPWNFRERILRIGGTEIEVFLSWQFGFFFCLTTFQTSHNLCNAKDGTKILWLPWFQEKSEGCTELCIAYHFVSILPNVRLFLLRGIYYYFQRIRILFFKLSTKYR